MCDGVGCSSFNDCGDKCFNDFSFKSAPAI